MGGRGDLEVSIATQKGVDSVGISGDPTGGLHLQIGRGKGACRRTWENTVCGAVEHREELRTLATGRRDIDTDVADILQTWTACYRHSEYSLFGVQLHSRRCRR